MSRSALLVSAAVTLGGPVEACRRMLGFDSGVEAAYGAVPPPPTIATPAYGLPPPLVTDAAVPVPLPTDAGATDAAPKKDAGNQGSMAIPAYGLPPPRTR